MKPYELPGGLDHLFKPSTADRIIGSKEAQRSTKTFIPTERAGILLAIIENHATGALKRVRMLYAQENPGKELSKEEALERYPGCRRWHEIHQFLVEHFASLQGFSVQGAVKAERDRLTQENQKAESSIKAQQGEA